MIPLDFSATRRKDEEPPLPEWITHRYTEEEAKSLQTVVELPATNGRMRFDLHKYVGPEGVYFQYQLRRR